MMYKHLLSKKIIVCFLIVVLTLLVPLAEVPTVSAANQTKDCHASYISVSLKKGAPKKERVYVELCLPKGKSPSAVHLLLHGVTYDHNYWDLPGFKGKYSYVNAAVKSGYATLNVDRIGSGKSSYPLSTKVDIFSDAWVAHQLVQALRKGNIAGPKGAISFKRVIEVGHSYGTGITWLEATKYKDVDGVILTGAIRDIRYDTFVTTITPNLYPASLDPKFGVLKQDVGYLTSRPGTRYKMFMAPGSVDPAVVKEDEKQKQTVTATELKDIPLVIRQKRDIRVPILLVIGEHDTLFCSSISDCANSEKVKKRERSHFGSHVPSFDAYVLPGGGHDINFMRNSSKWFNYALKWSNKHVNFKKQDKKEKAGLLNWLLKLI